MNNTYKTILTIVAGFLVLAYVFTSQTLIYVATAIGVLSLLSKHIANLFIWIWDKIALVLGYINTRILLSVLFYVFLVPIAFLSRLFSKDNMHLKKSEGSIFYVRNHTYEPKDLENMW